MGSSNWLVVRTGTLVVVLDRRGVSSVAMGLVLGGRSRSGEAGGLTTLSGREESVSNGAGAGTLRGEPGSWIGAS